MLWKCVSEVYHLCDQVPDRNDLRRGHIYLAHGFRGVSPWLLDPMGLGRTSRQQEAVEEETIHLMADRKQSKRGRDWGPGITWYNLQRHPSHDLLPPISPVPSPFCFSCFLNRVFPSCPSWS
jgi:hypothetical protein